MATQYKGTMTPASQVAVGTPIEIVNPLVSRGYYYTEDLMQVGEQGVVVSALKTEMHVRVWKDGEKESRTKYVPFGTLGYEVKVLTGLRSRTLTKLFENEIGEKVESYIDAKHGSYIGTDPEIFVVDGAGVVIPAWKFLPAKDKRWKGGKLPLDSYSSNNDGYGGATVPFWDGVQAEGTTRSMGCLAYLVDDVQKVLSAVSAAAKKFDKQARLSCASVVEVPRTVLNEAADEHAALGCAPSFNAYQDQEAINVPDPRALPLRFAGCHLHHGVGKLLPEQVTRMVKMMDAIHGVMMTSMLAGLEDPRRRDFYGRAGEYRLPKHGVEYRTPGSGILCHPAVFHLNFDLNRCAATIGMRGWDRIWKAREEDVRQAINQLDVKLARKILKENAVVVKGMLRRIYGTTGEPDKLGYRVITEGVEVIAKEPTSLEKNWRLGDEGKNGNWVGHSEGTDCQFGKLARKAA